MPTGPSDSTANRKPVSPIPPFTSPNQSRKRKSGQISNIHTDLDDNGDVNMASLPPSRTPAISPNAEFEGAINTINPMTGRLASPQSQSGTWFSDTLNEKLKSRMEDTPADAHIMGQHAKRTCAGGDGSSDISDFAYSTPATQPQTPGYLASEIDEYTHVLGIGWTKLSNHPDSLAAVRGHCKFIDKHFPLSNAEILLENKSKEQCLAKTSEGYFLFREDLKEGRLVCKDLQATMARLQNSVIIFDGLEPIHASATSIASPIDGQPADEVMELDLHG